MLPRLGLVICVLSLTLIHSDSAVLSIDLGSEWLKVAVVNLKPGQAPISIAINEMSKRKSPSLIAFQSGSRLIGEEAAGLIARYPDKVYAHIRDLIAKPYNHSKQKLDSLYLPYDIVEDSRGMAAIKVDDGTVYSVEEMLAMILSYALKLAEFHSKVAIKDAVITVPPYFGQADRKGLLHAAQLAGINVLSLINEHSGAALQYGIDKNFSNESRDVVFYDMGSSSTYAALVHYSAYSAKEYGKTVSINQFQVRDVRWNPELGGQDVELRLMEWCADEFNKQIGNGFDVRKYPKAMAKLKKQVKRTKEVLSANTIAPISVESLHDDRDFRSTITREKFEELCEDLWEKSLIPLKDLLAHSGLKTNEIYAVELIGGATRVPRLQAKLQEFLARQELDKHLDADEAVVLGAALHAANLSDGIKLNRKLGMIDGATYGYVLELDGPDFVKDDSSKQVLVQRMKKVPCKMYRTFIHNKDFDVSLAYESVELLPLGVSSLAFAQYTVSSLADASEKYSSRNVSSPVKANLHFSLTRSGVLTLDRAEAIIEVSEWVEVPKKNLTMENSTASANVSLEDSASATLTVEGGLKNSSEETNENLHSNGVISNASNTSASRRDVTEMKLKKQTFRVPLKVIEKTVGPGASLSKEYLADAMRKLEELDKKDAERRRTAESKNNLEGYIYSTREKIESSDELEKISTSEERESFIRKLEEVQEWLYMDGEDATASEFEERLEMLKAIGDHIFFRLIELTARPAAVELARRYLGELQEIVSGWGSNKSWIPKDRIEEVLNKADEFRKWLDEKENALNRIPASSTPVFTSDEVYGKLVDLQAKVASVNRISEPKPKVEKPRKNEADGGETENASSSASNFTGEDYSSNQEEPGNSNDSATEETQTEGDHSWSGLIHAFGGGLAKYTVDSLSFTDCQRSVPYADGSPISQNLLCLPSTSARRRAHGKTKCLCQAARHTKLKAGDIVGSQDAQDLRVRMLSKSNPLPCTHGPSATTSRSSDAKAVTALQSCDLGHGIVHALPNVDPSADDPLARANSIFSDDKGILQCPDLHLPCCSKAARVPEGPSTGNVAVVQGVSLRNPSDSPSCHLEPHARWTEDQLFARPAINGWKRMAWRRNSAPKKTHFPKK
ncbi:hypothetical protein Nepgr_004076 [Nepenthes gracilis]|uniref:Heat shock 70 kDa protein 17 n=1 Tax=Nepenthes gracilis TaxID=150966 RepID=A0AAD3S0Q0_NEPGR|nr:hypothetical protein Nepgr_004076 [Nepenthes gracilis]